MDRLAAFAIIGPALLAGCATAPEQIAGPATHAESVPPTALVAAAAEAPAGAVAAADVRSVDVEQLDDEPICEQKRRSGSRISKPVCYTREQRAALDAQQAAAARDYAHALERERALKDQQSRQPGPQPSIIVFQ
jgi:hypothetical protein